LGGGHVIAWSDASPLTNHWLRDGGAGLLFAREAARALSGGRVLEFDEYHQGYREGAGPLTALLGFLRTGPGHAALQGAVALLLLLVLSARRFGAPVPELPARRRSPLEHVSALAEAYRRAGARRTARTRLAQGLYRRLGLRLPGTREPGLPAGIERWASGSELETVWNRGEDGDLVSLAAAVDEVIREVRR